MDFGISLTPTATSWKTVQRAEELGFSHAWFYDTQLLCTDVLVAMTAAAVHTKRIKLCAGVLVPSNRIAPVAANAMASLNALAPGRIITGLGTGYTARRTMGLKAQKLSDIREYTRVMRALWRGEVVEAELEGNMHKMKFMQPKEGFINIEDPIPVHLSAFGPKARQLAAETADGFINAWMSPAALDEASAVRKACEKAGRDPNSMYTTCLNLGCVLEPGEAYDSKRARAQSGPWPAIGWHWMVEDGDDAQVPPAMQPLIDAYHEIYKTYEPADARYMTLHDGHLMYLRPEEEQFITAEILKALTLTGTPEEIRERVDMMRQAGYDQVAVQIVPGQEDALEQWAQVLMG
ncbi:MAG: LLM class flavin-dependent oxidoreductase [Proteobacteria bacterium]|nr:LLM class flavin-dependent oxidoreductase [Pseudomonadota bacterium]